ncbi:MAG: 50S ribosomal protein L6 [Planctomycetota bacterium]|nr:MAG: 50S ribosomal protein L6 [Planctomycetota bacterium]RLS49947.1 MAG: 50S ribosomal protein L6 [Planctomycetota bacterium]RLS52058.1 MAG: 50S ribosomal protein L6 [Planctomycetota bacterium]RLS86328.1 MAG: 50S ribosomal protein L6 [Planctomycetota bacterium]HAQ67332.1 50S ribosomal protein L6 [Phycisphaerales bacterium]
MSRIARKPVMIPAGVKVAVNPASRTVNFEGPKGKLSMTYRPEVGVKLEGANVEVTMDPAIVELGSNRAFWGTTRALIATAVEGVLKGYEKKLEIVGVGWGAKVQGKKLVLTVGFANTLDVAIPDGVKVEVVQMMITVSGPDKQAVGEFASKCRAKRKPEPYNGKGIKYTTEVIQRKQGKAFGS